MENLNFVIDLLELVFHSTPDKKGNGHNLGINFSFFL